METRRVESPKAPLFQHLAARAHPKNAFLADLEEELEEVYAGSQYLETLKRRAGVVTPLFTPRSTIRSPVLEWQEIRRPFETFGQVPQPAEQCDDNSVFQLQLN